MIDALGAMAANSAELKEIGAIEVPGEKLGNLDVGYVGQVAGWRRKAQKAARKSTSAPLKAGKAETIV
jgi:hypothetical protein